MLSKDLYGATPLFETPQRDTQEFSSRLRGGGRSGTDGLRENQRACVGGGVFKSAGCCDTFGSDSSNSCRFDFCHNSDGLGSGGCEATDRPGGRGHR
jgi:hypothetical protein